MLVFAVLLIWAFSLIAFLLVHKGVDDYGYALAVRGLFCR